MTSAGEIQLPTTGYTTCAVDEARQFVYIFQRDSYPETNDYYKFIVYDYANEQIINTKIISTPYAAMQAVDLYKDKIIVLNGLGSVQAPDGYRLYDLNGMLIGEYFFPEYSGYEPEGVVIDRSTYDLIIGLNGSNIYRASFNPNK